MELADSATIAWHGASCSVVRPRALMHDIGKSQ